LRRTQRRGYEAAVFQDVSRSARIGQYEFAPQSELIDQIGNSFRIHEALRAKIEAKSVLLDGIDNATQPTASFQQEHRQAELAQPPGARQPGDSAADD
jgi:hypothetical protein